MRLNGLEVKGHDAVEQHLIRGKPRSMLWLIVQALSECRGRLRHASSAFLEYPFYFLKHTLFAQISQILMISGIVPQKG
jgi:hypothetical protein